MPNYKRFYIPGGTYFFTLNLADRSRTLLADHINDLKQSIRQVQKNHPFKILALVVLPDHLHLLVSLPPGDSDFSKRISLIKMYFSKQLPPGEVVSASRQNKRERGIWQRRFFEHCIRDEQDLENHVNYIHFNPVKHGYVKRPIDWPYSSIHRFIKHGWRNPDWGKDGYQSDLVYE